jgi:hypothetical protein
VATEHSRTGQQRLAGDDLNHGVKIVRILHLCGPLANRARRRVEHGQAAERSAPRGNAIAEPRLGTGFSFCCIATTCLAPLRDGPARPYWTTARDRNKDRDAKSGRQPP